MAVPQHHRSGAHRARRHLLLVAVATLGAVAVASAALLWVLLSFDVLGVGDDLLEAGGVTPDPSGEATTAPSPSGEASPSVEASPAPGAAPSVAPVPSPQPSADRTLALDVRNGTGASGLAGAAAEALGDAGWSIGTVDNYDGDEIPTAVLYPEDDGTGSAAATAAAVVADLGVGVATPSADVDVLTVVLGPDYEP